MPVGTGGCTGGGGWGGGGRLAEDRPCFCGEGHTTRHPSASSPRDTACTSYTCSDNYDAFCEWTRNCFLFILTCSIMCIDMNLFGLLCTKNATIFVICLPDNS